MSVHIEVPDGKTFTLDGPASVRVGPNIHAPQLSNSPPPPVITLLTPDTAVVGEADVEMTVAGTGFTHYSQIVFNGGDEITNYVSDTELTTTVKPSLVSTAIAVPVAVRNGGKVSNEMTFTFTDAGTMGAQARKKK